MQLQPPQEIQISAATAAIVYGIFSLNVRNLSDVKAAPSGNQNVHNSVKTAAWTSTILVAGLGLLAKSPTIYIVGGAMIVAESWKYYHGNVTDPSTGKPDPTAFAAS